MVWDKWAPDVAASNLLMPLLGCVRWHWHCGLDGEGMAGKNAWFFSVGDISLGPDAQKGQSLVPSASPMLLSPSLPLGCGAVDPGR